MNTIQNYYKANNIDTKVHTVKGSLTSTFRKRMKLEKDRDLDYGHHAIDALIVASIKKLNLISKLYNINESDSKNEHMIVDGDDAFYDTKHTNFLKSIEVLNSGKFSENGRTQTLVGRFSYKIDTKPNRQIADETIYATRKIDGEDKLIEKYKDIYDIKFFKLAEDVVNNKFDNKYLMAKLDINTSSLIKEIIMKYFNDNKSDSKKISLNNKNEYVFKVNPLFEYKEEFGVIRKVSKGNKGPIIKQMKYVSDNLGNHIDISNNYKTKDGGKVILKQLSPYRTDFYFDPETNMYKFVTIRHSDVRWNESKQLYNIDEELYDKKLSDKKITNKYEFLFSMHRDEIIRIKNDKEDNYWKFTATNNDKANKIEIKPIGYDEEKRIIPTIGKKITLLEKYSTDVLGNFYKINKQHLKLEF